MMDKLDLSNHELSVRRSEAGKTLIHFSIKNKKPMPLRILHIQLVLFFFLALILEGFQKCPIRAFNSNIPTLDLIEGFPSFKIKHALFNIIENQGLHLSWLSPYKSTLWVMFLCISLTVLLLKNDKLDSLTVIKDVGIQLSSNPSWRFSSKVGDRFIPASQIIDLVIHEAFHGYGQVIFYLCVLTKNNHRSKNEEIIQVVFPQILPRKDVLLYVWKSSREVLFGTNKRYFRMVPGHGLRECSQSLHTF